MVTRHEDNNAPLRPTAVQICLSPSLSLVSSRSSAPLLSSARCPPRMPLSFSLSRARPRFRHCHRQRHPKLAASRCCCAPKTISATILRGFDNSRSGNAIVTALSPYTLPRGPLPSPHDPTYVEASLLRSGEVRPRKLSSDVVTHLRGENARDSGRRVRETGY